MLQQGKTISFILLVLLLLASPQPARAQEGQPPGPLEIGFDQNLKAQVPLDLSFTDETGQRVVLGQYFGTRPVLLVLAYYECPMLCTLVLNGMTASLKEVTLRPGEHFEVVVVSIDPTDTPDLAAAKKATYMKDYGRPETASAWHFLTGQEEQINILAETIGFRFVYEEESGQFSHPAGLTVLTPTGVVSHYFFGIEFNPADLRLALVEASENKIGNVVDQFYLLCYAYDPESGSYGLVIQNVLRLAGTGTVLIMAGAITLLLRSDRRSGDKKREVAP